MRPIDLSMSRGDTKTWRLSFSRGGVALPLPVGTLVWMTAKRNLVDADLAAVFKKGIGTGITIIEDGICDVTLLNTDTQTLSDRDQVLRLDVQIKEVGGRINSFPGRLYVTCDVTEGVV